MTLDLVFLLTTGQTLVEVPRSDGSLVKVPHWNADGAPSLNAWVRQQAWGAASPAPASGATPGASPKYLNGRGGGEGPHGERRRTASTS
jgi:hypothetical protein